MISLGPIPDWLLSGGGHQPAERQSYGSMIKRQRDYMSAQYQSSLHSGMARQYSSMQAAKDEQEYEERNTRAGGMLRPSDLFGSYSGLAFNPWQTAQSLYDRGWQMPRSIKEAQEGSLISQIRQRGKNIYSKNKNYEQVLKKSKGPDKGSGNSAVMEETYSTAETRNTGFSSKDFTSDTYRQNFAKLELAKGSNRLDPALKDLYKEKQYLADTGLVRRKPRWSYL